jgi:triphosphoribosyl-dephospho-CoA synthase
MPKNPMPRSLNERLTIGQCATLACLLEVSAPKPGNVHRGADFDDVTFDDFVVAAVAIGPAMDRAISLPIGQTVLKSIVATRQFVKSNCNLGMVLLFAPLAAVPLEQSLSNGVQTVLDQLTSADAEDVYAAIRLAQAGGLGEVDEMDVAGQAPVRLLDAMQAAAERDLVARQYVTGFETVFSCLVPWLLEGQGAGWSMAQSIVRTHLRLMAQEPDSLIARKCGHATAEQAARMADATLAAGAPGDEDYHAALADLDFWLRSDGHRRNPGTTADLVAAGLFVLLRDWGQVVQSSFFARR